MSNALNFSPSKLRELREDADMSRPALAAAMDRSEQTIWNWEYGTTKPRLDQLGPLSDALGCSVDDFFTPVNADDPADQAGPSKNASVGMRDASKA